jgi:hypothetical protein
MKSSLLPNFFAKRWLKVCLRCLHLLGICGVFSLALNKQVSPVFWGLVIIPGIGLLLLEALSNLVYFVQVRALIMYIKLVLLYLLYLFPEYALVILTLMVLLSGFISHASGAVRYYSLWHGRKITSVHDIKG